MNQGRRRPVAGRRLLVTSARPTWRGEYQELLNIFISSSFCVTCAGRSETLNGDPLLFDGDFTVSISRLECTL